MNSYKIEISQFIHDFSTHSVNIEWTTSIPQCRCHYHHLHQTHLLPPPPPPQTRKEEYLLKPLTIINEPEAETQPPHSNNHNKHVDDRNMSASEDRPTSIIPLMLLLVVLLMLYVRRWRAGGAAANAREWIILRWVPRAARFVRIIGVRVAEISPDAVVADWLAGFVFVFCFFSFLFIRLGVFSCIAAPWHPCTLWCIPFAFPEYPNAVTRL